MTSILVFSFMFSVLFFNNSKTYAMEKFLTVNGIQLEQTIRDPFLQQSTYLYTFVNGRIMVPIKLISNIATNGTEIDIKYDDSTQTVTCIYNRVFPDNGVEYSPQRIGLTLQVGNKLVSKSTRTLLPGLIEKDGEIFQQYSVTNQTIQLENAPIIYQNRMLIPLRDVANIFNLNVNYKDEIYQGCKYMTVDLALKEITEENKYNTDFSWRYKLGVSPGFLFGYKSQEAQSIADKNLIAGSTFTYYQILDGNWFMYTDIDGEVGVGIVNGRCDTRQPKDYQGTETILYFNKDCTKLKHVIINEQEISLDEGYKIINESK
jgi:hypothetical protein